MKISIRQTVLPFVITLFLCSFLLSCEEGPYAHKYVVAVKKPGEFGYNYYTEEKMALPGLGVEIDCEDGQSGCQGEYNFWGTVYDDVSVHRSNINTFYASYFDDTMDEYIATQNLRAMFPQVEKERPGAIDSVESGIYKIYVADGDSSIVFYKAPFDSIGLENIIFAIDRNPTEN
jgi:hypothetical protein